MKPLRGQKEEEGGEAEAGWMELPLLARLQTPHQTGRNERHTATRRGGGTYKRAEEEGRKRDTGIERKRESCIINFFAS